MAKAPFNEIRTIADVKRTANELGSKFFTPVAMKFFNSLTLESYYIVVKDVEQMVPGPHDFPMLWGYFVTSEKYGDEPRHYRVRRFELWEDPNRTGHHNVDIATIGDSIDNIASARNIARMRRDADVAKYVRKDEN